MRVRDCVGWAVRMERGLEEHGRAVSKSQVGYLCMIHVMIMQGVGGSRDQWPRDIFEEYMMTMKACLFVFLATP